LFSLPGGVFLDRRRKFPVYIAGELLMGACLLLIPLAWWMGLLSMPLMYLVAFCLGCVYTVAGSAAQIVLIQLVGRDQLVRAHSQNALASSLAEVTGPGLAGALIRVLGAPLAIVADACLLVGSVVLLRGIRIEEPVPGVSTRSFRAELFEGLHFVRTHRVLVELAALLGSWQFFAQMAISVQIVYAVRELGLSEDSTAMTYIAMGVGSIAAGAGGPGLSRRWGVGRSLLLGMGLTSVSWLGGARAARMGRCSAFV
jgi:MFS family permease